MLCAVLNLFGVSAAAGVVGSGAALALLLLSVDLVRVRGRDRARARVRVRVRARARARVSLGHVLREVEEDLGRGEHHRRVGVLEPLLGRVRGRGSCKGRRRGRVRGGWRA